MLSEKLDVVDIDQALRNVQPHDHLCFIYDRMQEWIEVIVPYFRQGIESNHRCIYLGRKENFDKVRSLLGNHMDVEKYENQGQLLFTDSPITNEENAVSSMIDYLKQESFQTTAVGYKAIRVMDEMCWAREFDPFSLQDYVASFNRDFMKFYPCIIIGSYNRHEFNARSLREILTAYPYLIRNNRLYINSYYIPPEILLSEDRDNYQLDEWFNNIERERLYGSRMGFLADVLQRSSQPFVASALDGKILTCNNAFCELTGYTLEELRQLNWMDDLYPAIQNTMVQKHLEELYHTGESQHFERILIRKDGSQIPTEEFVHQVHNPVGTKYYCSFINDITVRKRNEKAIRDSERLFRALFTSMHEGFILCEIICDEQQKPIDFTFLEVNPAFEENTGFMREKIIGKTATEVNEDLRDYWIKYFGRVALGSEALNFLYHETSQDRYFEVIVFSPEPWKFAVLTFDITRLKTLENQLQEQLYFLQNFIDSIPTPAFYRDTEGRFKYCNKAFEEALGLSRNDIIGQSLYAVLPRDLADKYREMDLTLLSTSGIQCYDWEFQYADGIRHDVIFNKAPIANTNGDFIGVVGTVLDITARKHAEQALRISEERFRNIFSQSPIGIALFDSDGCLVDINLACKDIFGIDDIEEVKSISLFNSNIFSVEIQDDLQQGKTLYFDFAFNHEWVTHKELFHTDKSGLCYLYCCISPLNFHEGEAKGGYLVQVQDISEQKKAEKALKESEAHLRRITENMVDMISQIDVDGIFEYVSPSHENILGYAPEELLGNTFYDFVHPDDMQKVKNNFWMALKTGSFYKTDYRYRRKDGTYCTLETVGKAFYSEEGKLSGAVFGTRDITERRQMENEIARLDRLRAVGEMAASLGHEIRNPMTTVRGFLQILQDNEDMADYHEYFDLMIEELDGANEIISEFLSLAKDKAVYRTKQDLNQVVQAIYPLITANAIKSDKQVELNLQETPMILVDPKEIRQLILNLSKNGLEAMEAGGCLTIHTCTKGDEVWLSVEDQGHGIDPELLEKIGTPFFTTKETGTGLGLAICYSIAARHHARIDVQTGPDGSTFSVIFQVADHADHEENIALESIN
ncbi:MAG TPA: PAS domain S-box protein [Syntrophomonadaceae bacterium]|nr:PAS domain S-box protein [Syntrophomonadaceae bacterium]